MEKTDKFIASDPSIGSHQHFPFGTVAPIHQNKIKVRRTYGWLCPFDGYKSNKWFNIQRHINSQHGWGSGEPVDSRTGETREEKARNVITRNLPNILTTSPDSWSSSYGSRQSYTGFGGSDMDQKLNQASAPNSWLSPAYGSSVRMPFLEAQEKRIRQLGYVGGLPCNPPAWSQHDHEGSINKKNQYNVQNASSMRSGNNPNTSKFQDRNELYKIERYKNEPDNIHENYWMNSGYMFSAIPLNHESVCLKQMLQLLGLVKQE
jgi:hypothetical protein